MAPPEPDALSAAERREVLQTLRDLSGKRFTKGAKAELRRRAVNGDSTALEMLQAEWLAEYEIKQDKDPDGTPFTYVERVYG